MKSCVVAVPIVLLLIAPVAIAFTSLSNNNNNNLPPPPSTQSAWPARRTTFSPTAVLPSKAEQQQQRRQQSFGRRSPLFQKSPSNNFDNDDGKHSNRIQRQKVHELWNKATRRLDTLESAGLPDARVAGGGSGDGGEGEEGGVKSKLKILNKLHNPRTYLGLATVALFRYSWCLKSPYYWFAVGFLIKWYRARYVFKIPVWDRQPNWNNVITSPEQEKDLKAFTCKTCGSTIFIAKSREFFFQGKTGIGGLGCFSCGAKGEDNFVMDRDRIVEDVADEDDYFDYEQPLDFVSRAERREVLKEAGGDEEKANQILRERANAAAGTLIDKPEKEPIDVVIEEQDDSTTDSDDNDESSPEIVDATTEDIQESESSSEETPKPKKKKKKSKKKKEVPKPPADDDDLDVLGLDDF